MDCGQSGVLSEPEIPQKMTVETPNSTTSATHGVGSNGSSEVLGTSAFLFRGSFSNPGFPELIVSDLCNS